MPELILGLDVGTSSARAMVVDLSGKVHGRAQAKLIATHPAPGLAEQDPWQVWKSVEGTIGSALADAGREASDLATIGLTTQRSSVVVWDRQTGKPLSPLILWTDLRGVKRSAELEAAGFLSSPLAAVAKLESAVDGIEGGRGRANSGELVWGTLDSYILHCLSEGAIHATDYSSAWSTCYLNTTDFRSWNDEVLSFQGLDPSLFPDLCDTYGDLGRTSAARVGAAGSATAVPTMTAAITATAAASNAAALTIFARQGSGAVTEIGGEAPRRPGCSFWCSNGCGQCTLFVLRCPLGVGNQFCDGCIP